MSKYQVTTEDGKKYLVTTEDASPSTEAVSQPPAQASSPLDTLKGGMSQLVDAHKGFANTMALRSPEETFKKVGPYLPAAGAALGSALGPLGTAAGGGLGQIAKNMGQLATNDPAAPTTATDAAKEAMIQTGLAGIPETSAVKNTVGFISKFGKKALSRIGEGMSGTRASNLMRAYNQGLVDTYLTPKTLNAASDAYGKEEAKLMMNNLTPEKQAALVTNSRGEATQAVETAMIKVLKNEKLTPQEALSARQSIDVVFPPATAKNAKIAGKLSQLRTMINESLSESAPSFMQASNDYARSKLRSDLLKPMRVNKSNPDEYSKLGMMLGAGLGYGANGVQGLIPAAATLLATSPLAMGTSAATVGTAARGAKAVLNKPGSLNVLFDALQKYKDKVAKQEK